MLAFNADPDVKRDLHDRMARHIEAKTLHVGHTAWDGNSGSPLGVSARSVDVDAYVAAFGYPAPLAGLLDPMTAMMGPVDATMDFVVSWINEVEPGADLTRVPSRFMLRMLETAETDPAGGTIKAHLVDLHRRDLNGAAPTRAEWSALRQSISHARETAGDQSRLTQSLALFDAASWPAGRGYTPLSSTLSSCVDMVVSQPDPDWGEAEEQERDSLFTALEQELHPRFEAGEDIDFMAISMERYPEFTRRFVAFSDRFHTRMRERSTELAAACLDCLRQAPMKAQAVAFG